MARHRRIFLLDQDTATDYALALRLSWPSVRMMREGMSNREYHEWLAYFSWIDFERKHRAEHEAKLG